MRKPTMMSLFDGSGGFPLAASMCGIVPVAASEVEPYPIAVTRSRFPNMKHLGSVTDINGGDVEPVDIISFGSPCQDLSVAGKRAGLKHEDNGDDETTRSGLFMEAVRIIKEMRKATNGVYPRFAIWENVPGAFSSNKGEDFRTVCEELIKIVEPSAVMPAVPKNGWSYADSYCGEGWSLAYRVFDAQYWGVPQRRRRIYLVLDLRGECAGEILFEREGLRGYFAEGRTPWQGTAADAENSIGADDRAREIASRADSGGEVQSPENLRGVGEDGSGRDDRCISAGCGGGRGVVGAALGFDRYNQCSTGNVCETLRTPGGGDYYPTVAYSIDEKMGQTYVWEDQVHTLSARDYKQPKTVCYMETYQKVTGPLMANSHPGSYTGQDAFSDMLVAGAFCPETGGNDPSRSVAYQEELCPTLRAGCVPSAVISKKGTNCYRQGGFADYVEGEVGTLRASGGDYGGGTENLLVERPDVRYIVRRLTPTECARLQGFADRWGDIDEKETLTDEECRFWLDVRNTHAAINGKAVKDYTKPQMLTWYNKLRSDGSEYKMWGNGIALPTALYVMQGIADAINQ